LIFVFLIQGRTQFRRGSDVPKMIRFTGNLEYYIKIILDGK